MPMFILGDSSVQPLTTRVFKLNDICTEAYEKNSKVYFQWRGMKEGDKETRFYEKHKAEITAFTEAYKYMTRHLNGHKSIPLDDWRREFATVKNEHASLMAESDKLSQELRSAEAIKRNAETVMGAEQQAQRHKSEIGL